MMQRTRVLAILVLGLPTHIQAAQNIPAELQEAIRLRAQAVAMKDAAVWDRLTTPDFTTVLEDGRLQTKGERLTQLKGETPEALRPGLACRSRPDHSGSNEVTASVRPDATP